MLRLFFLLVFLGGLGACTTPLPGPDAAPPPTAAAPQAPPSAPREFRAAWVASVANIDWPSRRDLTVAQQQAEMQAILERAQALKLNALVLQVRPAADALYASPLEPWSEYLTGEQGKAPEPWYDPLALWVARAHERGIELHAWINPYRARHSTAKSEVHASHISRTHPEAVKRYGESLWMDPGEEAAREHTLAVVADIVRRYDVDGIHIDDYFYPYPIVAQIQNAAGEAEFSDVDFPDEPAWQRYRDQGGLLDRADWRRQNVNQLIQALYTQIHQIKPWVRFGISPFGLGRPQRRASGIEGFSQYDSIYADAEAWLAQGWLDYLAPQLYWPLNQTAQAFGTLLDTWTQENVLHRHLWPGLFTSRIDDSPKSWQPEEIVQQIARVRSQPAASGHLHFSMVALLQDRKGISTQLEHEVYTHDALVPASPWLESEAPTAPRIVRATGSPVPALQLQSTGSRPTVLYAVWKRYGQQWRFQVQPAAQSVLNVAADDALGPVSTVVVSSLDRVGNESPRVTIALPASGE